MRLIDLLRIEKRGGNEVPNLISPCSRKFKFFACLPQDHKSWPKWRCRVFIIYKSLHINFIKEWCTYSKSPAAQLEEVKEWLPSSCCGHHQIQVHHSLEFGWGFTSWFGILLCWRWFHAQQHDNNTKRNFRSVPTRKLVDKAHIMPFKKNIKYVVKWCQRKWLWSFKETT